jgi:hypothetical protein
MLRLDVKDAPARLPCAALNYSRHPESLTRNAANRIADLSKLVMPGLVPGIHVLSRATARKTWMAGSSPAMTKNRIIFKQLERA